MDLEPTNPSNTSIPQSRQQQPAMSASLNRLPPELKAQIVQELYYSLMTQEPRDPSQSDPWLQHMSDLYGPKVLQTCLTPLVAMASGMEAYQGANLEQRIIEQRQEMDEDEIDEEKKVVSKGEKTPDEDGWVDEDVEIGSEGGGSQRGGKIPSMGELVKTYNILQEVNASDLASLHNLSLVNREFAELAFPWIWHEINLEETSVESILVLVRDILSRHAQHVKSLAFGQSDPFIPPWDDLLQDENSWAGQSLVEEIEKVCQVSAGTFSNETRKRRARSLLIGKVVAMCPNIEQVDCEAFQKHPIPEDAYDDDPTIINDLEVYRTDHALESIQTHLRSTLNDLTILVNDDGVSSEGDVAQLLENCPKLLRLDLEIYCAFKEPEERKRLHKALLGLDKLETLDVASGYFINDEFVKLVLDFEKEDEEAEEGIRTNPYPALKCLALVECQDLSFESFFNLIHRFSSTLEVLDIDSTPHANHPETTKKYLGRPFDLPKLRTLVLSTPHEAKFLESFVNCKLVEFSLGFCPLFAYKDVEDFITLHQESLKKVEIADDAALSEAQFESLEVFCHAKGITVELLEPDSDDEDEDEDDMNPSDLDEDDEGGWYDEDSDLSDVDDWVSE
ncbi:hypothetical protein JCM5350_006237 [Sporobolomyces pararoseus]